MIIDSSPSERRRRAGGFTLIELLTVVTLLGGVAALALYAIGRGRRASAVDDFAGTVKNVMLQARRRALNSGGRPVLVDIRAKQVAWCEIPDVGQVSCPQGAQYTQIQPIVARQGVVVEGWRRDVDRGIPGPHLALPAQVYFLPSGRMDTTPLTPESLDGLTIYFKGDPNPIDKRKLTIYPFSGRPRITENW